MSRFKACLLAVASTLLLSGISLAQAAEYDDLLVQAKELSKQGKNEQATQAAEKALRSAERAFGDKDARLVKFLKAVARFYELQGETQDSRQRYERALAILEHAAQSDSKEIAEIKYKLAMIAAQSAQEKSLGAARPRALAPPQAKSLGGATPEAVGPPPPQTRSFGVRHHAQPSVGARPARTPQPAPVLLPRFPWPPPVPSATYLFPVKVFAQYKTVGEVSSAIVEALQTSGYLEKSFYQTDPGGVALVTRLEKIQDDGAPAPDQDRWPLELNPSPSGLADFLRGLFFVKPGHYRVIVFFLQDIPFSPSTNRLTAEDAQKLVNEGANMLPPEIASKPFGTGRCTAYIYEFKSTGSSVNLVGIGLPAEKQLEKSGLIAGLEKKN